MTATHRFSFCLPHALLVAGSVLTCPRAAAAEPPDAELLNTRSLVTLGDTARLQRALAKARRGETVEVAVIGGSITAGAKATKWERNYGSLLFQWWRKQFPATRILGVNAGIGATGSNYAALRAGRDLLSKRPDVVVVEFGVNDGNTREAAESLEGLVRQILTQPQQPAVILLFMMHSGGGNAQEWHGKVGRHYALPMVSYRDALWPEIKAGRLAWDDVEADGVHPNDRGHAYAARFLTHAIGKVLAALPPDRKLPSIKPIPPPLFSDLYEHVVLYEAGGLRPVTQDHWALGTGGGGPMGWLSTVPGSTAVFAIPGRGLCLMEWRIRGPLGKAAIRVDGGKPLVRDAWFSQTWGGYRATVDLGRDLPQGTHRIAVTVLEEKNAESEGHEYRILGIGALGTPPPKPAVLTHAYEFDDGSVRDTAGGAALDGELLGGPTMVAGQAGGRALRFDGATQSVRFPALDLGDEFSISAWIKLDDNPVSEKKSPLAGRQKAATIFASTPVGDRNGLLLFVNNPWGASLDGILQLEVWHGKSVRAIHSVNRIPPGTWHHVIVAGDNRSGEVRFYIDGKPEPVTVRGSSNLGLATTARPWCLGATLDGANGFRGCMDSVRIYRGRLTGSQAKAIAGK